MVKNDTNAGLMHNKVEITDGSYLLTGSLNWTVGAEEENNENLIVLRSDDGGRSSSGLAAWKVRGD